MTTTRRCLKSKKRFGTVNRSETREKLLPMFKQLRKVERAIDSDLSFHEVTSAQLRYVLDSLEQLLLHQVLREASSEASVDCLFD
jgi:hypothetical protein